MLSALLGWLTLPKMASRYMAVKWPYDLGKRQHQGERIGPQNQPGRGWKMADINLLDENI